MAKNQEKGAAVLVTTTMRIPQKLLKVADRRSKSKGLSRTKYIVSLIENDTKPATPPAQNPSSTADIFG